MFFACDIYFEKVFDKVKYDPLYQLIISEGIDSDDIRIIINLYFINGEAFNNIKYADNTVLLST